MKTLFLLIAGHYLGDFALQNDFVAKNKARPHEIWFHVLTGHALIHGGIVCLVTGSLFLGIFETIFHWAIDFMKCEGHFGREYLKSFTTDQVLHIFCKILHWLVLVYIFKVS